MPGDIGIVMFHVEPSLIRHLAKGAPSHVQRLRLPNPRLDHIEAWTGHKRGSMTTATALCKHSSLSSNRLLWEALSRSVAPTLRTRKVRQGAGWALNEPLE